MKRLPIVLLVSALTLTLLQTPSAQAAQVTSGLLIDLNAANTNSYSGSGNTWSDLAGGADNGTLTNGPTFSASPIPAIVFDGNNDYVQIANTNALQVTTSNAFTVMAWAKVDSYLAGDAIFGKQYADAQVWDGYSLVINSSNRIALAMNGQSRNEAYTSTTNVFTLGTWTLFTAVIQFGGGSARPSKAYVNGVEVASGNNADGSIPNNTAPFRIGEGVQGYGQRPAMSVGAFAVYGRALSAQEIADSYNYYLNYVYLAEDSSISLGSLTTANKGRNISVTATVGAAGKVRFFSNGKRIPNCINVTASGSPLVATCTWKPATSGSLKISATLYPNSSGIGEATTFKTLAVSRRSTTR
jgi:hypothetical protein